MLWTKIAHRSKIFGRLSGPVEIHQIPHVIFGTKNQFLFKLYITLQCHETSLFCIFSTTHMKINQLPYVIFQAISQFSYRFSIIFWCHDT